MVNWLSKQFKKKNSSEELEEHLLRFTLRIPKSLAKMIDDQRKAKAGNISKNTWILEAITRRLKK